MIRADSNVVLQGSAFDSANQPLASSKLVWSSGREKLGRGATLDVQAADLGNRIKLRTAGPRAAAGSDTVRVRIQRVAPFFTHLEAELDATRKRIEIEAAASSPGNSR